MIFVCLKNMGIYLCDHIEHEFGHGTMINSRGFSANKKRYRSIDQTQYNVGSLDIDLY